MVVSVIQSIGIFFDLQQVKDLLISVMFALHMVFLFEACPENGSHSIG